MTRAQQRLLSAIALVTLAIAGANIVLAERNRLLQAELAERARFVQQSLQLEGLYRDIVKALGELALRSNDATLRDLLARQGITLNANPSPPAGAGTGPKP